MDPFRELGRMLFVLGALRVSAGALLYFGANCPFAWEDFPATSSIAASTPPSTSRSSPALSSALLSHFSCGFLDISEITAFSFTSQTFFTSFLHGELRLNKRFDPFFSRQAQAQEFPLAFHVNVKIKKRAALAFRAHPLR